MNDTFPTEELLYREGRGADLRPAFELSHRALADSAQRMGLSSGDEDTSDQAMEEFWLRRLRGLGFKLTWPSWVLCSVPLPGLDRYVPTRPPILL